MVITLDWFRLQNVQSVNCSKFVRLSNKLSKHFAVSLNSAQTTSQIEVLIQPLKMANAGAVQQTLNPPIQKIFLKLCLRDFLNIDLFSLTILTLEHRKAQGTPQMMDCSAQHKQHNTETIQEMKLSGLSTSHRIPLEQ